MFSKLRRCFCEHHHARGLLLVHVHIDRPVYRPQLLGVHVEREPGRHAQVRIPDYDGVLDGERDVDSHHRVGYAVHRLRVDVEVSLQHALHDGVAFRAALDRVERDILVVQEHAESVAKQPPLDLALVDALRQVLPLENAHRQLVQAHLPEEHRLRVHGDVVQLSSGFTRVLGHVAPGKSVRGGSGLDRVHAYLLSYIIALPKL